MSGASSRDSNYSGAMLGSRRGSTAVAAVAAAALAAGVAVAQQSGNEPVKYAATGGEVTGLRPTAVGLPQIGESGTVGAGDLPNSLRQYHDSGAYARDLQAVAGAAAAYLDERLDESASSREAARPRCTVRYRKVRRRRGQPQLYRRVRVCVPREVAPPPGRPAIVLDIDETSLSNYDGLVGTNFSSLGNVVPAVAATGTAIGPTLRLYRAARERSVAVFFITGRPSVIQSMTESNLRSAGYDQGWDGIFFKPGDKGTVEFKAGQRAELEQQGFDIVANVGDQESDLSGGHADRSFKLPNPFYFISDR